MKLFFSDSFCANIETLLPRLPHLKRILGLDGIQAIFSNDAIPSMSDMQWADFMEFIQVADKRHVLTYTRNLGCVTFCKKKGWDTALAVYQLPGTLKSRRGFIKAVKEYSA